MPQRPDEPPHGEDTRTGVMDGAEADGEPDERSVSLVFYHRDGVTVRSLSEGTAVVVGRSLPSDVVIVDPNLSRKHARFLLAHGRVEVEDLGSTNGTKVDGRVVERSEVPPGGEVVLGPVTVSLHLSRGARDGLRGIESHDRFLVRLEHEATRVREFARPLAILMVRSRPGGGGHLSHWLEHVQRALRRVDFVGLYGPRAVLVALPEMDRTAAIDVARRIAANDAEPLVAGVATMPEDARTVDELVARARSAATGALSDGPVQAATGSVEDLSGAPAGPVLESTEMQKLYATVERVARSAIPVLIIGETGSGKELVARAIHATSPRSSGPLRGVNCAAIPATLMESALFGHERGAFTGADKPAKGIFEEADGGTVFLDEVGELSAAAQAALLRVLEEKRLRRLGGAKDISVDVRIVAATNRDLEVMAESGSFREDLLYRLNTMTLRVPPLREHPVDIDHLVRRFLAAANEANATDVRGISPRALELMQRYRWPGNVRELRNAIERAVVVAGGSEIQPDDLPERVRTARLSITSAGADDLESDGDFKDRVRRYETKLILDALEQTGGSQTEAAKLLKMPFRTFAHKMKGYGIKKRFDSD